MEDVYSQLKNVGVGGERERPPEWEERERPSEWEERERYRRRRERKREERERNFLIFLYFF